MKRPLFEIVKSPNQPDTENIGIPKSIYQIKIILKYSDPKIWRRVLIPSDMHLPDFHEVIQTVMGWHDEHLHHFIQNKIFYSPASEVDGQVTWGSWQSSKVDYTLIKVSNLLQKPKAKLEYEYDFGDGWMHDLVLEKILPWSGQQRLPLCTDGALNCPPEDCGGMGGYYGMLAVLKDPRHEEYEDLKEWVGEDFDPSYFNVGDVNANL